jgi:hypothetical protein
MTDHAARPRTPAVLALVLVLENRDPVSTRLLAPVGLLLRRRG